MTSIYKVPDNLPALVINGKVYSGLQSVEAIEKTFPQLETIKVETPATTVKTTGKTTKTNTTTNTANTTNSVIKK
jgi:hypothetical protein